MERSTLLWATLVGAVAGALFGFLSARFLAPGAVRADLLSNGLEVRDLRWVDEAGVERLTVAIPPEGAARLSGRIPPGAPVLTLTNEFGEIQGALVLTPGLVKRASGYQ